MVVSYNPYLPGFYEDPRPVYRRLRDDAPAHWSADCNFWVLSRYDDVRAALTNWKLFSSEAGGGSIGPVGQLFRDYPNLLMFDPPRHTQLRKVLATLITPDRMLGLKEQVRARVVSLLAPLEGSECFDLTQDFAERLAPSVIADLIGIPQADVPVLMQAVDKLSDHGLGNVERNTVEAISELRDYYADFLRQRALRAPGDDIAWHLLEASRNGILAGNEALGFAILVTIAGGETTTKMIGNMALLLHDNPDQRGLLAQDPGLMRGAVEEALRYDGSTHMLTRSLTEEVTLHGQAMHAGDTVALIFNAANNDERKYPDPDRFDVQRKIRGDHLAFGAGVHACLGSPLARLELVVSFEEILKRWPRFGLDRASARRYFNPFTSGFRNLPFFPG